MIFQAKAYEQMPHLKYFQITIFMFCTSPSLKHILPISAMGIFLRLLINLSTHFIKYKISDGEIHLCVTQNI